jgi:hypothetical protein
MEKPRLFFARCQITWSGTIAMAWQVAFALTVGAQASGTVIHRNLYSGMLAFALLFSSCCFWFNALFWGPSAGWRKGLGWSDYCRRLIGESEVSYEKRMSRLIRCYGDQAVHGWIIGASAYTMIFLINFYWHNDIHDFLLVPGYTTLDLANFLTMQKFYSIEAGIAGVAVAITLVTFLADALKRYILAIGNAAAVQVPDGTNASGASQPNGEIIQSSYSPLTGSMQPK